MGGVPKSISKRHLLCRGLLALAVGPILPSSAHAQSSTGAPEYSPTSAENDALREEALAFIRRYSVPGLAVAIAYHGRLVYTDAFGLADATRGERLMRAQRFRIASASKPVTSAAIFSLVEEGRLQLSQRVFGTDGALGNDFGPFNPVSRIEDVTVEHLLTHTAGGWSNDANDPMFSRPELGHSELIAWTLRTHPLNAQPGTNFAYSNFGYCLLGRIIEKVSSQPYEVFVRRAVLEPCGITEMSIAGNTLAERQPNEVRYHPVGSGSPYSMNVRRMDSHGGWIARPEDLVRFATHVDGFSPASLLKPITIRTMITPSSANPRYAKGWLVNSAGNWWHNGSLPGTTSILVRTSSYLCWAAVTNIGGGDSPIGAALDRLMWAMVRKVPRWMA